jgi:hypothetical protein
MFRYGLTVLVLVCVSASAKAQISVQYGPSADMVFRAAYAAGQQQAAAATYVDPYFRMNGGYVDGHYRSLPDGNFYNNYSTYPNVNPYTGSLGTRYYPSYRPMYYRQSSIQYRRR